MTSLLTIGQVAKRCGVGVDTVRFYERERLFVQPSRRTCPEVRKRAEATNQAGFPSTIHSEGEKR